MPYVRGYYRRSAGGGGGALTAPKRLDVAIYGEDGATLLHSRRNARYVLESLAFDNALPGGFLSCSFTLRGAVINNWPGRSGLKVVVRRGEQVVWLGWIEDIKRRQLGRIQQIDVSCYGPWQVLQQRLLTATYEGTIYGEVAIESALMYCQEISNNADYLASTSMSIDTFQQTNKYISDLVKMVCDIGNSSGQQMLFAIWEPARRTVEASDVLNPGFEIPGASAAVAPESWTWGGSSLTPGWSVEAGHDSLQAVYVQENDGSPANIYQNGIACEASTAYTVSFWAKNKTGIVIPYDPGDLYFTIAWKNSSGGAISTTTGTTVTPATSWTQYTEVVNSPAGAVTFNLTFYMTNMDPAGIFLDDVSIYATWELDTRPTAHLWARDLSAADYYLWTGQLDDALDCDETTRELANNVIVSYGSTPDYTTAGEDATSQADYRQRDVLIDAGSDASSTMATALRTAHLARYKDPLLEPGSFKLARPGALRTAHGQVVWPEDVRAGDRIKIMDGPAAGEIMLLTQVSYNDGTVSCTPESAGNVPILLAKVSSAMKSEFPKYWWWRW